MKKFLLICLSVVLITSCVSMQDDIAVDSLAGNTEVSALEMRISEIDAAYYFSEDFSKDKNLAKKSSALISDIETALKDVSLKKAVVARMYAIAGCAAFDSGNKSLAKKYYESSNEAFKGDARALILARRLGLEKNFDEKIKLYSDKGLLVLEKALLNYSKSDYSAALASFDEAFLSLDPFYRSSYSELRDTSWNLRNLNADPEKRNAQLLALNSITVMQMIMITDQNPELLFNYTSGKPLSEKELYDKVAASGLLNPVSQPLDGSNSVTRNSAVTRLVAARFLWNLYNQRKNSSEQLTKYSSQYKPRRMRSPINDVKIESPDFDAVLGCVENEIMHLEDGIEFGAEKEVSGVEFSESVSKIK